MTQWVKNATTIAGLLVFTGELQLTQLYNPTDMIIGSDDVIYLSDAAIYGVERWSPVDTYATLVVNGTNGFWLDQFFLMANIAMDFAENIYILDSGNARVTKWAPGAGTGSVVAGGNGVGVDASQLGIKTIGMYLEQITLTIWIADTENHRIVKWPTPSTALIVCGSYGSEADQFLFPTGLFVDESDSNTLYVADSGNHRIQQWPAGATNGTTVAGITGYYGNGLSQLWNPQTLIVDMDKNMFIVDTGNGRIMRWKIGSSSGEVIAGDSSEGSLSSQLNSPVAIGFDSSGGLFVLDAGNFRLQKFAVSCSPNTTTIKRTTRLFTTVTSATTTTDTSSRSLSTTRFTTLTSTVTTTVSLNLTSRSTATNIRSLGDTIVYSKLLSTFLCVAIIYTNK